jgi:hypothetical protein
MYRILTKVQLFKDRKVLTFNQNDANYKYLVIVIPLSIEIFIFVLP